MKKLLLALILFCSPVYAQTIGPQVLQIPIPCTQGGTGAILAGQICGTATNDDAASGKVGEFISSSIAQGSAVSLTTAVPVSVTSITLSAGDWDVYGNVGYSMAATTNVTRLYGNISTTPAGTTLSADSYSETALASGGTVIGNAIFPTVRVGPFRITLTVATNLYLVALSSFTVRHSICA